MIGQVCHHFGFSYHETLWEIDWAIIQRMLIDSPGFDPDSDGTKTTTLTEQTTDDVIAALNKAF